MPSRPTIPTVLTNTTLFRDWLLRINGSLEVEEYIYDELDTKAPIMHRSAGTLYGVSTTNEYGHVKIIDTVASTLDGVPLNVDSGTAITPKGVYDKITEINETINNLSSDIAASISDLNTNKAPIPHLSTTDTYGVGDVENYGHLRINPTYDWNNIGNDIAVSMDFIISFNAALQASLSDINASFNNYAIKNHASSDNAYGLGTQSEYGHVKLIDTVSSDLNASAGTAITPKGIYDINESLESSISALEANISNVENTLTETISSVQTSIISTINAEISALASQLSEQMEDTYTPIYHASENNTYGLGTSDLYGHLKITDNFDSNIEPYTENSAISVSAYAFYNFLYSNGGYIATVSDINASINVLATAIANNGNEIEILHQNDESLAIGISQLGQRINTLENLPFSYDTLPFSTDLEISSANKTVSTFICTGASNNVDVVLLNELTDNYQFTIKNESDYNVKITPTNGKTIDNNSLPIILGKYDSVTLKQNPGDVNFTVISSNTTLSYSEYEDAQNNSISVSMASRESNYFEINTATCALHIIPANADDSYIEFSEKIVILKAIVNTEMTYHYANDNNKSIIWMNNAQKPAWGAAGETLILKLLEVGNVIYATPMHNSQIVDDLDSGVRN